MARTCIVHHARYTTTQRAVASANGGGSKLEVVYKLANGRTEAEETVQHFPRPQLVQ